MLAAAFGTFLSAVEDGRQNLLEPLRLEQPVGEVLRDEVVQLLHRDRAALAAGLALPRFDRAGVVTIPSSLPGPERHGAAAVGAEADADKEGGAADHARWRDFRVAGAQMRLHRVERRLVDERRHGDSDDLADGLQRFVLGALVELVLADIGLAGQDAVNLSDAPAPAVTCEDAVLIEIGGDVLDAHRPRRAVALQRQAVDQPHCVGVQRIDFELLLDLRAALFGGDDAIPDRRQRAVPEALARILFQGPQDVLGVLLRLVFVEQRHDLPHHDVHRIVAHLLGDRHEPNTVLCQLADVEFQFEVIAEEAREAMDDDDIERRGLARARLDHALELGAAVVGGGCAWLHVGLDKLIGTCGAIGFALSLLIRNRDIMLGLPRRRDAQVKGGAQRHCHGKHLLRSSAWPEHFIKEVAEPSLEHVQFGGRDRDAIRPIVGDGPIREVVFRRPAHARPGLKLNVEVIGQGAQAGAGSGHTDRIAPRTSGVNGRSLSHGTLRPSGSPAALADGDFDVDMIDVSLEMYGRGIPATGRKNQSFQSPARTGWPRFSLAVQLSPLTNRRKATADGANDIDITRELSKSASSPVGL